MEEPSRDANGSSEPTRPNDDDPNAREGASADRDWSSGRLSVVEADSAAAAFRPSWETAEWAAPSDPTSQPAQAVAAGTTKSFGEAPVPLSPDSPAPLAPARADSPATGAQPNGAKSVPQVDSPSEKAEARAKKAEAPKAPKSGKGKSGKAGKSAAGASKAAGKSTSTAASPPVAATPVRAAAAHPTRASERPLSTAEVRAISAEITDGYPAVVVSSRPTKAIVVGVAVVLLLVVGTVWSMTDSPEAAPRPASASASPSTETSAETSTVAATPTVATAEAPVVPVEAPPMETPPVETPVEAPREVRVTVRTVPENATLTLDGAPVSSPIVRPQDLLATTHTLEARAEGFEPRTQSVRFDRDGSVRIELRRVPAPTPPPVAMTPVAMMPSTSTMATTSTMAATAMAPSMAPVRITTMTPTSSPMRPTMASGAGFTTDNPY